MSKQTLNLGTAPAGADGDTVRAAFVKLEANMAELYNQFGATGSPLALPNFLPVSLGGTGGNTAATARTALGLGTVAIESTVPVIKGGTGSTTAATARSALGAAASGANTDITAITGLTNMKVGGATSTPLTQQGIHIQWNTNVNGVNGTGDFICNMGAGSGGFTWRTVNSGNTATGPVTYLSYAGNLSVPGTVSQGSDRRLKINDVEIAGGLEKILSVRPVEFDRRSTFEDDEYPFHEVGVIAQELSEVLPLLVVQPDVESQVWRVNYIGLIPYLVAAVKDLKAELDALKRSSPAE